jgi:hypothetical protein
MRCSELRVPTLWPAQQTDINPSTRLLIRYFCDMLICELDICLDRGIVASLKSCFAAQAQSEAEEKTQNVSSTLTKLCISPQRTNTDMRLLPSATQRQQQ